MKPHATSVAGNLVTSADDGSVWAVWQVLAVPYRYAGDDDRLRHHSAMSRLFRALRRPALLFSACQPITPTLLDDAMREGAVPSDALDRRIDETVGAYLLDGTTRYERTYWLAAQIEGGAGEAVTARAVRAGRGVWRSALGTVLDPLEKEEARNRDQALAAQEVERALGLQVAGTGRDVRVQPRAGALLVRRAELADVEWLSVRLARRGTEEDVALTDWDTPERATNRQGMMRLNDAAWTENYVREVTADSAQRRHVAAEPDCQSDAISYQASLVLAREPAELWFPGGFSEHLVRAGEVVSATEGLFPVDWHLYVKPRRDPRAKRQVASKLTNAQDQPDQTDEGTGVDTAEHVLADIDALKTLSDRMQAGEPRLDTVTWFTISAPSYQLMRDRERTFRAMWGEEAWNLARVVGEQMGLARASQPGAQVPKGVLSDYYRVQLPDRVAASAPYSGAEVGDPFGAFIGVNLGNGLVGPFLWEPGWGIRDIHRSGSAFFVGVTGAGKSASLKTCAEAMMVRGSRFVAVDPVGEYVPLALATGGQIVDPLQKQTSLDPLTIYAGMLRPDAEDRERCIEACVAILDALSRQGIEPMSALWAELRRYIEHAIDERLRLGDVVAWIVNDAKRDGSVFADLGAPLGVAARIGSLSAIFDPHLHPFSARAPLSVIVLRGLQVPKGDRADASSIELQGLALLTAAVHAAKEAVYEDRGRYGAVILDEARVLMATPYGYAMVYDLLDKGRKYQAGAWISVTDPEAVPAVFYDQADTRFVFRLESDRAVRSAARLLGPAGEDNDIAAMLTELRDGECFVRDVRHRAGKVQILLPLDATLREAVLTDPVLDLTPDHERAAA